MAVFTSGCGKGIGTKYHALSLLLAYSTSYIGVEDDLDFKENDYGASCVHAKGTTLQTRFALTKQRNAGKSTPNSSFPEQ